MMDGYVNYKVPFIKPSFPTAEEMIDDYKEIVAANWYTNFGPFEQKFSESISDYIGDEYFATTFSSATTALMASILAILGNGDGSTYVVMPSFTFAAGADALMWCGYRPFFVDIEDQGLHMDIDVTQALLNDKMYSGKVVGLLLCNAFGVGTVNIDAWERLAEDVGLPLIIDSAAGFGSLYSKNRKLGSAGECEVFSFHATKPFAIGEGGAVVSKNKKLIETLRTIQNFGFDQKRNATTLGFNAKLQEISAAIGLRQFTRFSDILQSRKAVFQKYKVALNPRLFRLQENAENASLCFATVIVKKAGDRDRYLALLKEAGVDAKTYYSPSLHKQAFFKSAKYFPTLHITDLIDSSVISLPVHDDMDPRDITLIVDTLNGLEQSQS